VLGFQSHVNVFAGDAAYDTVAEVAALVEANTASANFAKIWEKTVPAQQALRWGYGSAVAQRNQGYMYFAALDAGVGFEDGILRLVQTNARETKTFVVLEIDSTRLHTTTSTNATTASPTDINQMLALPEQVQFPLVGEDSKLQLWFKTTAATTTVDVVTFSIPVTIYQ
jgi:hypothetical protein